MYSNFSKNVYIYLFNRCIIYYQKYNLQIFEGVVSFSQSYVFIHDHVQFVFCYLYFWLHIKQFSVTSQVIYVYY